MVASLSYLARGLIGIAMRFGFVSVIAEIFARWWVLICGPVTAKVAVASVGKSLPKWRG